MESTEEFSARLTAGARDIFNTIEKAASDTDGLNDSTVLQWMSGMTGLSCQMPIWEALREMRLPVQMGFMVINTAIGKKYYMGDTLNYYLLESPCSVWKQIISVYCSWNSIQSPPDLNRYVQACITNIGKAEYRIWGYINPFEITKRYKLLWDNLLEEKTRKHCNTAAEWSIMYGLALQMAMYAAENRLGRSKCFDMTVENLLYMAKMDFNMGL